MVNIVGLSLGMASALLILIFIRYETSFDKFHPDHENTYRVATGLTILDQQQQYAVSSAAFGPTVAERTPEIISFLRVFYLDYFLHDLIYRTAEGKSFFDTGIFAADSTFFDFFHADLIDGSLEGALDKPWAIVLTRNMAMKVYGHSQVAGERIQFGDSGLLTVSAVIEDPPLNTHFRYNALLSLSTLKEIQDVFARIFGSGVTWESFENTFGSTILWTYIKTTPDFSIPGFMEDIWPDIHRDFVEEIAIRSNVDMEPIFQPLASIHLESNLLYETGSEGHDWKLINRQLVNVFFVIAIFLIIIAVINYTNMAISQFNKRRKEMAMVRILGSRSRQVFSGFFAESFITSFISLIIALVLVEVVTSPLNSYLSVAMTSNITEDWFVLTAITGVFIFTATLAGIFPATFFAHTPPLQLLMTRLRESRKTLMLKKTLVSIQFAIAAFMVSAALVVHHQFTFMKEIDLGYQVENIAGIELKAPDNKRNIQLLDSILSSHPLVATTAATNFLFSMHPIKHTILYETTDGPRVQSVNNIQTTDEYLQMMGIEVEQYNPAMDASGFLQGNGILINEAMKKVMGFDDPVGKEIVTHFQFLEGAQQRKRELTGVITDVLYALLNQPVEPLVILPLPSPYARFLAVRFTSGSLAQQKEIIQDAWNRFDPGSPLILQHLEENVDAFFNYNERLSNFFSYFAWLCIIIASLGVFGITAYNMEQKRVEIGIRKVMGANPLDLSTMFLSDYFILFFWGGIAGLLVSRVLLGQWLDNFAFSAHLSFYPFMVAGFLIGLTVFLAVLIHIVRIFSLNPTITLRQE